MVSYNTFHGYTLTISDTDIKKQTGLNSSNIISIINIIPTLNNGGGGFKYFLSGWTVYSGGGLDISMLCENNCNIVDNPVHFDIFLKMLNKLI